MVDKESMSDVTSKPENKVDATYPGILPIESAFCSTKYPLQNGLANEDDARPAHGNV